MTEYRITHGWKSRDSYWKVYCGKGSCLYFSGKFGPDDNNNLIFEGDENNNYDATIINASSWKRVQEITEEDYQRGIQKQ